MGIVPLASSRKVSRPVPSNEVVISYSTRGAVKLGENIARRKSKHGFYILQLVSSLAQRKTMLPVDSRCQRTMPMFDIQTRRCSFSL